MSDGIVKVVLFTSAILSVASAIDCSMTKMSYCLAANMKAPTSPCVWANSTCQVDPCYTISDEAACVANSMCFMVKYATSITCMASQRMCSSVTLDVCTTFPWCLKTSDGLGCLYYEPAAIIEAAGTSSSSCLQFPMWCIALIVLWILVMIVLGGIIALAIRQRRLDAITEVEESEVNVDSVHINKDNFSPHDDRENLGRPLSRF